MNPSRRSDDLPRAHRLRVNNRSALSDCCGAPIFHGDVCSECREYCEEGVAHRPARFDRRATTVDDFAAAKNLRLTFRDEDLSGMNGEPC